MAYSDKVHRPLRKPAQRRLVRQGRRGGRHRHGRRAGVRRRDEAADQGRRGRRHRGRQVQDLRLRLGDRVVVARHRMGEGQDARPGADDQEHADRRGAGAAAGEDPLLDPRRGRDQGRGRRLPEEARRRRRRSRAEAARRAADRRRTTDDGDHADRKRGASTSRATSPSAARASGLRLGVRTTGCSGLAYKLEFADDVAARGPARSRATA